MADDPAPVGFGGGHWDPLDRSDLNDPVWVLRFAAERVAKPGAVAETGTETAGAALLSAFACTMYWVGGTETAGAALLSPSRTGASRGTETAGAALLSRSAVT